MANQTKLLARVQAATEETPYTVEPTAAGFDVTVDLPNQRWQGLFQRTEIRRVFTHRVKILDERAKKLSITDELFEVTWTAGVARLGASVGKQSGRVYYKSFGTDVGGGAEYRFDSEEGRRFVVDAADQLGWKRAMSANAKIGLVCAGFGGLVALVTLVALAVVGIGRLLG